MAVMSKLEHACKQYSGLLEKGKILAIDPSSGSKESMPGYAYFEHATLLDSGTLAVPLTNIETRLYSLCTALRKEFTGIDLLIVESLPPFMQSAGSSFRSRGVVNLHMSVGAIYGALGCVPCIGVPPASWHAEAKRLPFSYTKSDENDALILAHTVYTKADVKTTYLLEAMEARSEKEDKHTAVLSGEASARTGKRTSKS